VLESRVGSFDLGDSTLLAFLQRMGMRAVVPESAPTPEEARRIARQGLLVDQTELRSPAAVDAACLYAGRAPRGAGDAFVFAGPDEVRAGDSRAGCLLTEESWRAASRLLKRKLTRDQATEVLGLNFARFWKGAR
jgi:hypothetical protein